ncbi:MAG: potassium channel family protein [Ruminococcus sp.]
MSIDKTYAVLGLGSYGMAVATELYRSGAEIIVVDKNQAIINEASEIFDMCKCADVTDPLVIRELGISNIDTVIISMAGKLENTITATMLCKEAGAKQIIAKCSSELGRKILYKIGADKVVFPEKDSGIRLAKNLLASGFVDTIEISDNISMVEMNIKPEWAGKTLAHLNLRKKYNMNVVAIKNGDTISTSISPEEPLAAGSSIVVIADTDKLKKLS